MKRKDKIIKFYEVIVQLIWQSNEWHSEILFFFSTKIELGKSNSKFFSSNYSHFCSIISFSIINIRIRFISKSNFRFTILTTTHYLQGNDWYFIYFSCLIVRRSGTYLYNTRFTFFGNLSKVKIEVLKFDICLWQWIRCYVNCLQNIIRFEYRGWIRALGNFFFVIQIVHSY